MGREVLGLIAGEGALPCVGAARAREAGRRVVCVAFRGLADPALEAQVDEIFWTTPGDVTGALAFLREREVSQAVLAGKVAKGGLVDGSAHSDLDPAARALLEGLPDWRDQTLLAKVADLLAAVGVRLLPQSALAPELLAGEGPLGSLDLSPEQRREVEIGLPLARAVAGLDVGQGIAVKRGAVVAVEALEGTDAMLARAGALAPGAVAIKVARPQQDPRFDVPAIGPRTVEVLAQAGLAALAFEAGATLVLEREALGRAADRAGVPVVGVALPGEPA